MIFGSRLVRDLTPYVQPFSVAAFNATIEGGVLGQPLYEVAAAAGAVLLDPTSTLCHAGANE